MLLIIGNFDLILNDWSGIGSKWRHYHKNPKKKLARLIDMKFGKVGLYSK